MRFVEWNHQQEYHLFLHILAYVFEKETQCLLYVSAHAGIVVLQNGHKRVDIINHNLSIFLPLLYNRT